jgi:hypothetical protein
MWCAYDAKVARRPAAIRLIGVPQYRAFNG